MSALALAQVAGGFVNVLLLAPVWMQLVHLLLADLLWVAFVLLGASALAATPTSPAQSRSLSQVRLDAVSPEP